MSIDYKKLFTTIKEYLLITLGISLYVLAWNIFLIPNNLIGGGVSGVSSIIQYASGGVVKVGYSYFVINLVLLAIAMRILGKGFGAKTVYAMVLASVGLSFGQNLMSPSLIQMLAIDNGKLMCTIMGGIMSGVGIGMSISQGGSTGGTDIIALIICKYRSASPGRLLLSMDVVVILSSLLVPSVLADGTVVPFVDKLVVVVYGFVLVTISSYVLDLYLSGAKQSVQVMIISRKYNEIADAVINQLHRGVTLLDGQGWYTKEPQKVVIVVTRKENLNLLLKYIKTIDPVAFLSVTSVTGVYGQGFDTIKGKKIEQ